MTRYPLLRYFVSFRVREQIFNITEHSKHKKTEDISTWIRIKYKIHIVKHIYHVLVELRTSVSVWTMTLYLNLAGDCVLAIVKLPNILF